MSDLNEEVNMVGDGPELWLFTVNYPFGRDEAFLENEVPVLCRRFKHVRIFPLYPQEGIRPLPSNASVTILLPEPDRSAVLAELWQYRSTVLFLVRSLTRDLIWSRVSIRELRALASRIRQFVSRAAVMRHTMEQEYDPGRVILYSFWLHDWATVLGMLRLHVPGLRFVARAHGFDLYPEQHASGYIPFHHFNMAQVSRVFCVSQAGLEHLRAHYPSRAGAIELARLGTGDRGLSQPSSSRTLELVSCSHVIPRKRVHLIAEALSQVQRPVHWVHFGDGQEMGRLRALVERLPPHVSVELHGAVSNSAILDHYRTRPVDAFILLSSLEGGVAVVLQEAASFGIPLIASDSRGVRDIVVPETGVLLPNAVDTSALALLLDAFKDGPWANAAYRQGVRCFWEAHFDAGKAYGSFSDRLIEDFISSAK